MNTIQVNGQTFTPSKVVCIGRNYAKHVAELNNELPEQAVVFMKPNSALSAELSSFHLEPLHYEGEISFVVKDKQFYGVGFGLDLTKRQLQSQLREKQLPWERAKAFNGGAVFDQFTVLADDMDVSQLSLELWIDGELTQKGGVSDMLFKPDAIVKDIQGFVDLEDGDIVMTGTPEGVGVVQKGSEFIGRLFLGETQLVESRWIAQ